MRYFAGASYCEVCMDIASSVVAANIVSLCRGYAKFLVVDMAVTLEGHCEEELPEKILSCCRITNLDLEHAAPLDY
eukprot:CAMPEP_0113945834 /NCGR_PEP_ID=MMETSP1339-20121228/52230_1 /TAXON_ID=94617 /ORGANISM="Fibrocapsa japonica" /LENGTH=75 /DNA_ID=CAMNT_0000951643 /DNA_START=16 /DNA_END=243 /DNA_ORIENTATION=- /assembly_acc=CAM_ASM_000762